MGQNIYGKASGVLESTSPPPYFLKIQNFLIWIFIERMHELKLVQPLRHNECIISLFHWQRINQSAWNMHHRWKIRNLVEQTSINIISTIVCHQFVQKMKNCFEFYNARRRRRFFGGIFGMRNFGLNFPPLFFQKSRSRGGEVDSNTADYWQGKCYLFHWADNRINWDNKVYVVRSRS